MKHISVNLVMMLFFIFLPLNVSSATVKQFRIYDFAGTPKETLPGHAGSDRGTIVE